MNEFYEQMVLSLKTFKDDKVDYEDLLDETQQEITKSTRVIKREVIDMADMIDRQSALMLSQDEQIKNQARIIDRQQEDISVIRTILENKFGKAGELDDLNHMTLEADINKHD